MGWWPTFAKVELNLPRGMTACQEAFEAFYGATRQNRRLIWVHASGNANIKATYGSNTYEFQIVTLQAVALNFFNDAPGPVSFEAVRDALGCDAEIAKRTLHSLACGKLKVLLKTPEGPSISPSDTFEVNARFSSNMRRQRIPMASLEESHNPKRVEEDRSHTIEACIVRVMKARKTLPHNSLVAEVMNQLQFFKPNPKHIKKRIEHLIERDYLERDTADPNIFKYVA